MFAGKQRACCCRCICSCRCVSVSLAVAVSVSLAVAACAGSIYARCLLVKHAAQHFYQRTDLTLISRIPHKMHNFHHTHTHTVREYSAALLSATHVMPYRPQLSSSPLIEDPSEIYHSANNDNATRTFKCLCSLSNIVACPPLGQGCLSFIHTIQ